MLRSMSSAISGMQAFQTDLDVVGNNIANVNTVGFKSSRADFSDILSQTLSGGNAGVANGAGLGGTNPQQVGLGVKVAATTLNFSQGSDATTSSPTDLAINGAGMFVVSSDGGNSLNYTRAGNFTVDSSGNLVLPNGSVAQGYHTSQVNTGTNPPTYPTTTPGSAMNLKSLLANADPTYALASAPGVQIGSDGGVSVETKGNGRVTVGYIALANFSNTAGLQKQGDNLFSQTAASGAATYGVPGDPAQNMGGVVSGELEQSNVDLAHEFSEMIVAQNGFVANTHMIGTDNTVLQALVNMKHS